MTEQKIVRTDITSAEHLDRVIIQTSKENPDHYITYVMIFTVELWIYLHKRKPSSINAGGTENTYRWHGGFFKNGQVIKPSQSFIAAYDFVPCNDR